MLLPDASSCCSRGSHLNIFAWCCDGCKYSNPHLKSSSNFTLLYGGEKALMFIASSVAFLRRLRHSKKTYLSILSLTSIEDLNSFLDCGTESVSV